MQNSERRFELEYEGKTYSATYYIEKNYLTMKSQWGSKSAKPGADPIGIAKLLLTEVLNYALHGRGWPDATKPPS